MPLSFAMGGAFALLLQQILKNVHWRASHRSLWSALTSHFPTSWFSDPSMTSCGALNIVNGAEWCRRLRTRPAKGMYSFYSSLTDAITTDAELMSVPIDDHIIVRGHAVFDTASLCAGRLYRLQIHLRRLIDSAAKARLKLPFGPDTNANIERMTQIICATCLASGQKGANVRYWLTAGPGNLGVTPSGCVPSFYVLVFAALPFDKSWSMSGIREATVPESEVPLKPKLLAELKSTNYMLNALTAMAAQDRGGTFGIGIDSQGYVKESCVLNVAVVGADRVLRTPPFDGILAGTTIRRAMALAEEQLLPLGLLEGAAQEPISLADLRNATEVILLAGDTHVYGVTSLDGKTVGEGEVGVVTRAITTALVEDATKEGQTEDHIDLPSY